MLLDFYNFLIATNFDKIKKLVTDFIKGDTFNQSHQYLQI